MSSGRISTSISCGSSGHHPYRIGYKVHPVTASVLSKQSLSQLHGTTQNDRGNYTQQNHPGTVKTCVMTQVLKPYHYLQSAVHAYVGYLVDKADAVQPGLGRIEQRQEQYGRNDEQ